MWFRNTRSLWRFWLPEIIHVLPRLQLKLSLLCLLLLLSQGLSSSPRSLEVEAALCFSFIRQMPPSQAMSNQSAPSVRQHPPGLVCSLLASAACHGLALRVCLPCTFFPPHGMQMLCLCLALSVWLPQLSSSLTSHWPSHLNQMYEQVIWEKDRRKNKEIRIENKLLLAGE